MGGAWVGVIRQAGSRPGCALAQARPTHQASRPPNRAMQHPSTLSAPPHPVPIHQGGQELLPGDAAVLQGQAPTVQEWARGKGIVHMAGGRVRGGYRGISTQPSWLGPPAACPSEPAAAGTRAGSGYTRPPARRRHRKQQGSGQSALQAHAAGRRPAHAAHASQTACLLARRTSSCCCRRV